MTCDDVKKKNIWFVICDLRTLWLNKRRTSYYLWFYRIYGSSPGLQLRLAFPLIVISSLLYFIWVSISSSHSWPEPIDLGLLSSVRGYGIGDYCDLCGLDTTHKSWVLCLGAFIPCMCDRKFVPWSVVQSVFGWWIQHCLESVLLLLALWSWSNSADFGYVLEH